MAKGSRYDQQFKENAVRYRLEHPELSLQKAAENLGISDPGNHLRQNLCDRIDLHIRKVWMTDMFRPPLLIIRYHRIKTIHNLHS